MRYNRRRRCFMGVFIFIFLGSYFLFVQVLLPATNSEDENFAKEQEEVNMFEIQEPAAQFAPAVALSHQAAPILLWWTPFIRDHKLYTCKSGVQCLVTQNRSFWYHENFSVAMFYGTSFDPFDLPWPRKPGHEWAVLHEESPHNNYLMSHAPIMELFNYTATFKRQSHFPLTTMWLRNLDVLTNKKYFVPVEEKNRLIREEGLGLIAYVHSDCGCLSNRDVFVKMLMKYLPVDSMGRCLHNKDLPEHISKTIPGFQHEDFHQILAKYKFVILAENNICDDYITEKFWRPFITGSVPIVISANSSKDFLPTPKSALYVSDYHNIEDLVKDVVRINNSDEEYNSYLSHKFTGLQNDYLVKTVEQRPYKAHNDDRGADFIRAFTCYVCEEVWENRNRKSNDLPLVKHQATVDHYGCPVPMPFKATPPNDLHRQPNERFSYVWQYAKYQSLALKDLWTEGTFNFTKHELKQRVEYYKINKSN